MNLLKTSLLAAALFAAAPMAMAGTASASIPVTLTLQNSCGIVAAGVNFGTVTSLASNIDAAGSVTVTCTSAGTYTVAFNGGTTTGGTMAQRLLLNGASNTIQYNLFQDSARATILGDGTSSTATVGGTGNGSAQVYQVYGRVAGGQGAKPTGVYNDSVTATVTF